ncbi:squalene--hopene cyclase [Tautonia plasticadhaerens]|uniref:Squalene--hopene cyclase n=1 Tax=Tautonia plasticadhaerens TaxID=2527974 RepID=A0A518H0B4_9BACT|nr:squalene--hopene cyclase [Tautonia plasticadhaerens]QDV34282.1 Squalene--hopene cyclase [Tautonia plasticadhaerens]
MIVKREGSKLGRGPAAEATPRGVGTPPPVDSDALDRGLAATRGWLLGQQRDDGHWVGELEGDTILESEFVLLLTALGREEDEVAVKLCKYLYEQRLPEGGWAIYPGGPFDVSASVKSYFALKLAGVHPDHPEMAKVRDRILEAGGAEACNSFTRFYLALLGQMSYDDCPYVPPELIFLPTRTGLSLYDMSSWTRTMVVPLSILSVLRPVRHLPPEKGIAELFRPDLPPPSRRTERACSWSNFFVALDRGFKWAHRVVPKALRRPGLAAAHRWMIRHFEGSEGLGAIFPAMVYSIFALRSLGYDDDHVLVRRALGQLEDLMIEEGGAVRVQPCVSPTWDTAIAAIALADSGVPADDPSMTAAARWLLDREISVPGDWQRRRPGLEPTGWAFEYRNDFYPDIDDTAMVLLALGRTALAGRPEGRLATDRAVAWLLAMQNRDGGWAAFDVDIDNQLLTKVPFADHNAILDPSCADITARILEILGTIGYRQDHPAVSRGLEYLWASQEPEGCWYGRWGVNYIYGTWQVLLGLRAIDFPMGHPSIQRAADWLESAQQEDGGWGESCRSYDDPAWMGRGVTTASQTAWAVNGLIAAGRAHSPSVRRGVSFLLRTQNADGTWDEPQFTGTGFPKVFYLRYHLYRIYFPLMALARYRAAVSGPAAPRLGRSLHSGALACGVPADPRPLDV